MTPLRSSPIEPHPIAAHLAPPSRGLPLLLSGLVYLALGTLGYSWVARVRTESRTAVPSQTERIYVIDLAHMQLSPPPPEQQPRNRGGGNDSHSRMPPGTGTIDEHLLEFRAIDPSLDSDRVPDQLPTELPLPGNPSFLGTKDLPVAKGGDGRPRGGRGTGDGDGTGDGPPGKGALVLKPDDLDFVQYVKPEYPRPAIAARVEGIVWVRVKVSEDGLPLEAKALSGPEPLVPCTLKAVKEWRFGSLRRKGIHGTATVDVSVLFVLVNI